MKNYTITVNGNVYDVTVEEGAAGAATSAPKASSTKSCSSESSTKGSRTGFC